MKDVHPALDAVLKVVRGHQDDRVKTDRWQRLVRMGLADALCQCLLEIADSPYSETTDEGEEIASVAAFPSRDFAQPVLLQVHSSYNIPLQILAFAATSFEHPPNAADNRVISALRKHWSAITKRVCDFRFSLSYD